ncbi:MAG: hypothetical protein J6C96_01775 [Oscillospiraceae bacterium]|nr:hypothetical protein [Oscillospiraceae bacterium]
MVCKNCGQFIGSGNTNVVLSAAKGKVRKMKKYFCLIISLILMMSFSSCSKDGGEAYTAYYNDSTVSGALETYMNALMNDDYDTYLKITHKSDSESSRSDFNSCKKGYVGMESISYGQVKTDSVFSIGAKAEYMVAEYNDDGTQKLDFMYSAGRDFAYGLVKIAETKIDSGVYYVSVHHRNFNFNYNYLH